MGIQKWHLHLSVTDPDGSTSTHVGHFVADWWTDGHGGLSQQVWDWVRRLGYPVRGVELGMMHPGNLFVAVIDIPERTVMAHLHVAKASLIATGVG